MTVGRKIYLGVISGAVFTTISVVIGFVQFRLIMDFLPKELVGIWFLFLSFGAYIAYFDLGISPTISREVGFITGRTQLDEEGRDREISDLFATCLRIFQILALIVFFLGFVLGGLFLWRVAPAGNHKEIGIAWVVFTFGASINILGGAWFATLYGLGYVVTERILRGFTQILGLALSALFLYFGYGIIGLSVAWVLQGVIVRAAGWITLHRKYPVLKSIQGKASKALFKKIAIPSLKMAATGLGAILILQTDNIVIASVLGPAAIPPYEAVAKLANHCFGLSILIISSSTPFLSKLYAAGDIEGVRNLTLKNVRYSMAFMTLTVSFLALFGDRAIHIWLGKGNFIGFPVLWVFLAMLTLEVHHNILGSATMATGRIVFYWIALGAGLLNIVLTLILVKHLGLLGVALGTLFAQMLTNNWYVTLVSLRLFKIPLIDYLKKTVIPLGLVFLIMLVVNKGICLLVDPLSELTGLILAFFISALLGLFLVGIVILSKQERQKIFVKLSFWRPSFD